MNVSLAEALSVRGGPLQEDEVWAVLNQGAESLQELFRKASPSSLEFIISPWSLLFLPSGSVSFTDRNVSSQDLRAFTAPEVLQNQSISSLSDVEKIHIYSLGMTLYWGVDYEVPENQPIKLGDHLNSVLLGMCEDFTYSRVSVRTILDACSAHIRNRNCAPAFSYIRKLVKLVLGSITKLDQLAVDGETKIQPDRSQAIRDRLRGKGLPPEKKTAFSVQDQYKAQFYGTASLNKGLSRSMGFLAFPNRPLEDDDLSHCTSSDYNSGHEDVVDVCYPYQHRQDRFGNRVNINRGNRHSKIWASTTNIACHIDKGITGNCYSGDNYRPIHFPDGMPSAGPRNRESHFSDYNSAGDALCRHQSLGPPLSQATSASSALSSAYDRIRERQKKLQILRDAMDVEEPVKVHQQYHSDTYSTSSDSHSVLSSDPDFIQVKRSEDLKYVPRAVFSEQDEITPLSLNPSLRQRQDDDSLEGSLVSQEIMIKRQEEEIMQLQTKLAHKQGSQLNPYSGDIPKTSMLDITRDLLREVALETTLTQRKLKSFFGPEFVKMTSEPSIALDLPNSILAKRGKSEDVRRKVNVILLSGQRLELTSDIKSTCRDVFEMVVAHIGLVEHHLFGLAYLKENEYFFVDPDAKLLKVAPEGWKEETKKRNRITVNFTLFFRIKFFVEDVSLIQHNLTRHQHYLQLRRDILEEKVNCDDETALLLASLALQAEFGDYQPEVHGKAYFRLEHYLPVRVIEKLDQTYVKEELPKLHSTYFGASEKETEFEFLKVCQKLQEYGVHFYRVTSEKKSSTGIMLGICSKGVFIFEVHSGLRSPVLRFPWRETKKISSSRKKVSLQNTSDGIKHVFLTDSSKTCQYLLHFCSCQHKFHLQMRTRQNNQEIQDIEKASLSSLNFIGDSPRVLNLGRAISTVSLAGSVHSRNLSQAYPCLDEKLKRLSYSELALNGPQLGRPADLAQKKFSYQRPRAMSKSFQDLSHIVESPVGPGEVFNSPAQKDSSKISLRTSEGIREKSLHQRARSDTESVTAVRKLNNILGENPLMSSSRSFERSKHESDSSSVDDAGQAYVVGISMHNSTIPSTPADLKTSETPQNNESSLAPSDREITLLTLKKDPKYGLGFQIVGGKNMGTGKLDLGIFVSSVTPGGPADVDGHLKPGDQLVSINNISLEGGTLETAVEILQNAPDDVTIVISQPRDNIFTGPLQNHDEVKYLSKSSGSRLKSEESSSEELFRSLSHLKLLSGGSVVSLSRGQGSLSSQDSRTESASLSQYCSSGFYSRHLRDDMAGGSQHRQIASFEHPKSGEKHKASADNKKGKTKSPVIQKEDHSDRGDSDMDEETYSSSQEQQVLKKELSSVCQARKTGSQAQSSSELKPGDIFEVELSKKDNSLGISVTGGVNTSVKYGGIYVKAIIPNGAAERDGRIQKGDRVLSVDGNSLEGTTHKQAVETLRNTGQVVKLVLEKGHLPLSSVHAPVTPKCTPPNYSGSSQPPETQQQKISTLSDYPFVTDDNTFEVKLQKSASGLGFSFCMEDNFILMQPGANIVRVKKLFPGQPAEESAQIAAGDVILEVNGVPLKGLPQQKVISALRGTSQVVTLLLCRPSPGTLPSINSQSPVTAQKRELWESSHKLHGTSSSRQPNGNLSDSSDDIDEINDEHGKYQLKSLSRRDSYSDSTDSEEITALNSLPRAKGLAWNSAGYQTPETEVSFSNSQCQTPCNQETMCTIYYTANQTSFKPDVIDSNPPSPLPLDLVPFQSSPHVPEVPSPTPLDETFMSSSSGSDVVISHVQQETESLDLSDAQEEEFEPEVELNVTLIKSEKGSLGFTVTKGIEDTGCYVHDIVQDPAKSDNRLKRGDRLIKVNGIDVTGMSHTEAVNLLRNAPETVKLVVGRVLEVPEHPIEPHMLPKIILACKEQELGLTLAGGSDSPYQVVYISTVSPGSLAALEGSLKAMDIIHYINEISTLGMSLSEAKETLKKAASTVVLQVTRAGHPVIPCRNESASENNNASPDLNGIPNFNEYGNEGLNSEANVLNSNAVHKEHVIHIELEKPSSGGLGFCLVGSENGIFVKSISPDGVADTEGSLHVGDKLLQVNGESMVGVSHTKAVTTIRKARGRVHLVVSRVTSQSVGGYQMARSFDSNANIETADHQKEVKCLLETDGQTQRPAQINHFFTAVRYHSDVEAKHPKVDDRFEDTDCDGVSLPEDSPEASRIHESKDMEEELAPQRIPKQTAVGNIDGDCSWGSDVLPQECVKQDMSAKELSIVTTEELSSLPLVVVPPDGQYTGSKLKAVIRMMRGLIEQHIPEEEFENLQVLKPLDQCLIGQTKENKKKNRYKNILPYDTTRVTLGKELGYINASFIRIPLGDKELTYIACQGPLPNTVADFWEMVWEQNSDVIAMMTQEVESGKVKCQRYWPDTLGSATMVNNRLQLTLLKSQQLKSFLIRIFEILDAQTKEAHRVTHLNFTSWPDHGTPDSSQPEQLLTFISYMRHIHRLGPIIAHCSAGIGRSGTLICIDAVLELMSKDLDFDISNIVRTMRLHRHGMIQTQDQYIFCYHVILHILRGLQSEEDSQKSK